MATTHNVAYRCDLCGAVLNLGSEAHVLVDGVPLEWARLDVRPMRERRRNDPAVPDKADLCPLCVRVYDAALKAFVDVRKAGIPS